jgi:Secretion system C-terminal sorting domain
MMKKTTPITFLNYCLLAIKRMNKTLMIVIGLIASFTLSATNVTKDATFGDSPKAPINLDYNPSMMLPTKNKATLNTKIVTESDVTSDILSGVVTYNWKGFAIPVIQTTASNQDFGCNPPGEAPTFTVMDDCSLESTSNPSNLVVTDGGVINTGGCNRRQTWTANYSNACDFSALSVSITYTWKVSDLPIITTSSTSGYLGCNPTRIIPPVFTVRSCSFNLITLPSTTDGEEIDGCNRSQTWTASYRNDCGNLADLSITYTWKVAVRPRIIPPAGNGNLGCNPTEFPTPSFTVADACNTSAGANVTFSSVIANGCSRSQTWTANFRNDCGLAADPVSFIYTWTVATTPSISANTASRDLGCNPAIIPTPSFTVTDACNSSAAPIVSTEGLLLNGCSRSLTWTASYTNSCGLAANSVSTTFTWNVAVRPSISANSANRDLGCNPTVIAPSFTVSDACNSSAVPVVSTPGIISNGCGRSQTWTARYTNSCGLAATNVSTTFTWNVATPPRISTSSVSRDLGCNPAIIPTPSFTVTDACNSSAAAAVSTTGILQNGCDRSQTWTARYTNSCGLAAILSITFTWNVASPPRISTSSVSRDLGCNPTVIEPRFTVTDACNSSAAAAVSTTGILQNGCDRRQTWTASYTNSCGLAATLSITFTWNVAVRPIISTTARNLNLGCNPTEFPTPSFTVRDDCNPEATPTVFTGAVIVSGCDRSRTWTAVYTNSCGINATNVRITNTWKVDVTPPVIGPLPGLTTIDCEDEPVFITPSVSDACGGPVNLTYTSTTTSTCKFTCTVVRKWTATDACDNSSMASQTIIIQDKTAPLIECPKNVVVDASLLPTLPCEDLGGGGIASVTEKNNTDNPIDDAKIDFRQPQNQGHPAVPLSWMSGINNKTQSEYFEGMGVPQRIVFTGLTGTKHSFKFRHEAVKHQSGDKHGYDFLMSWEQAIATAANIGNGGLNELKNLMNQACDGGINGMAGNACADLNSVAYATPTDEMGNPPNHHGNNSVNNAINCFEGKYGDRKIEMRGNAPITDYSIAFDGYSGKDDDDNYAWYTISWTSTSDNVMIKLAGRVAQGSGDCGYGECYGAANGSGAPYHFKLEQLDDKSLGNRDNQIILEKGCNVNKPITLVAPQIFDNCSSGLVPVILKTEAVINPDGSKTYNTTWKATDDCGNSSTCKQTTTVVCGTNTSLTITCPKDNSFTKLADMPEAKPSMVSITSDCGDENPIILVKTEDKGTGCATDPHVRTNTFTVKNICGNEATCVQQLKGIYNLSMGSCSKTDACKNGTGSVTAGVINNAVGPVVYRWQNASYDVVGNTATVSNLPAGVYYLWLRDDCMLVTDEVTINNVACESITQDIVVGKPNYTLLDKLMVVPNPASTQVDLSFNTDIENNSVILVTDLSGRVVRKMDYKTNNGFNKTTIPLDNIVNGGYIISIKLGDKLLTERLFIIK